MGGCGWRPIDGCARCCSGVPGDGVANTTFAATDLRGLSAFTLDVGAYFVGDDYFCLAFVASTRLARVRDFLAFDESDHWTDFKPFAPFRRF